MLFSDRVQNELRVQSALKQSSVELQSIGYQKLLVDSKQFLLSMNAQINPTVIRTIFFMFHTVFKRVFDQIIIDDSELRQVKSLLSKKGGQSVILVPSFKSYMDMILIQYINLVYGLDLAFLSGNKEWADITLFSQILRLCGGFFLEQKKMDNPLNQVLLEEFFAAILRQKYIIAYSVERRRQRSGKVVKPKQLNSFERFLEGFVRNQDSIKDVTLLPMTINYDKVYEGQQFPYELIGDEGKRESII